jgi:trans-aconitate methyltransferase
MSDKAVRVSSGWLALRERADAAARARELVERLLREIPSTGHRTIHDLGGGTGAMGRWLAPLLPGSQHWVVRDRDAELLRLAAGHAPRAAADGAAVTVECKRSDITALSHGDLAGATLITASALLDMLTAEELHRLLTSCSEPGCPLLLTLSVTGHVELSPADPLDREIVDAFNAHQRRPTERGRLLGPDAVAFAVEELRRLGAEVHVQPSPWRLGARDADLAAAWFRGWVSAAVEQQAELAAQTSAYGERRLAEIAARQLAVTVEHADLLAVPSRG